MGHYLITGGAGFIGSHLARIIAGRGERVRILDDFSSGRRENLESIEGDLEVIEGDLRDRGTVRRAVAGIDFVLHHGARASVPQSIEDPAATNEVNVGGTLALLEEAHAAKVARFVFASSTAVYGNSVDEPKREEDRCRPLSPYAASKLAGEMYGFAFHAVHRFPFTALRYFNVYGPRQDENASYAAAIPIFIDRLLRGETPVIYGDGTQSRDFVYVEDVVRANLLALEREEAIGRVFNIARGESTDLNDLVRIIGEIVGRDPAPRHDEARPGEIRHSRAYIDRARKLLRFEPEKSLDEGLRETIAWYRSRFEACGGGTERTSS